jgi:cellobiose-specific phosphotransferase system component IIC
MKFEKTRLFINRVEENTIVRVIRDSLVYLIPVLLIGAFALIIQTFPLKVYQDWIATFAGGFILKLANLVNSGTFGILSGYMTYSVSRSFMQRNANPDTETGGATIALLLSFFILAGAYLDDFSLDCLGPKSMFLAIIAGLVSSALYLYIYHSFQKRRLVLYSPGADRHFNLMLSTAIPIVVVALVVAAFDTLLIDFFHEIGCDCYQGYLYSPAVPLEES